MLKRIMMTMMAAMMGLAFTACDEPESADVVEEQAEIVEERADEADNEVLEERADEVADEVD